MKRKAPTASARKRKVQKASTLEVEQVKGKSRKKGSHRVRSKSVEEADRGANQEEAMIEPEDEVLVEEGGEVLDQEAHDEILTEEVEDEVLEHPQDDLQEEEEDGEGDITFGPEDPTVLTKFKNHVAVDIWRGVGRKTPIRVLGHQLIFQRWTFEGADKRFLNKVSDSGLLPLTRYTYRYNNSVLLSSFIERWHSETNSFHFRFGEKTITLDDVAQLLGVPIEGHAVHASDDNRGNFEELVSECLGVTKEEARVGIKRGGLALDWLHKNFANVPNDATDDRVDCCVRAYLLFLLGCTLFVNKTGNKVHIGYLYLLKDVAKVKSYAWGAGALAYLYRELGQTSKRKTRQMVGYSTLLEAWIQEHFPMFRHGHNADYTKDLPRVARWYSQKESTNAKIQWYREVLDDVEASKVVFDPYKARRSEVPEIAFYTGHISCMNIVEPYMSDRVLRQFSLIQLIPGSPLAPSRDTAGASRSSVPYMVSENIWENWRGHLVNDSMRVKVKPGVPWESHLDYLPWFRRVSWYRMAPGRTQDDLIESVDERIIKGLAILSTALQSTMNSPSHLRQSIADAWKTLSGSEANAEGWSMRGYTRRGAT